ncbi:MAG TPA: cation:dicarboxylase symporter family transporter, partial [Devosia sp.]|nr:cation:dicarboxylase symporter family transporter [Devosia sp.]
MAIALALVLGVIAGAALHHWSDTQFARTASLSLPVMADMFLRLIKMIIAPLVLATLMTGIAQMEDIASLGRIGARALLVSCCKRRVADAGHALRVNPATRQ